MRRGLTLVEFMIVVAVMAIVLAIIIPSGFLPLISRSHVQATVIKTERIVDGVGDQMTSKYLVFTDKEVLENTDCFILFKFNSSDIYGKLKVDQLYDFDVYGFRVPFFSWYRNIVKATPMEEK